MLQTIRLIIITGTHIALHTLGQKVFRQKVRKKIKAGQGIARIGLANGSIVGRRRFPKTVVRNAVVRLAVGGVLIVVPAVFMTHLVHPTSCAARVVMVRHKRQQQHENYRKRNAKCVSGFLHAAKIAIRFCKRVAFCPFTLCC